MASPIQRRKDEHVELCASDAVAFRETSTLLECVQLVHQALSDLSLDEIDTRVRLLGKELRAPLIIAAMTGGIERAREINRDLASIAEAHGYGFGLGSQRTMQNEPATSATYQVRDLAPTALLLGNLGVVQAREMKTELIAKMVSEIGADALCLHLNPAMELIQPEGDRDFRGGSQTFGRLARELPVPVVAKETGCGLSYQTAVRLRQAGVATVDTSGAGGTSWVGVEALRSQGESAAMGQRLWDWGIPTAASVHLCDKAGMVTIATGGIASGVDAVRALTLGATAVGVARPLLRAYLASGKTGAERFMTNMERELRTVMLLCGAKDLQELRRVPRLILPPLASWMALAG